jgi:UDP-3-O-[3-hydroxymyristoyl] glucosamine N-acyltransferase
VQFKMEIPLAKIAERVNGDLKGDRNQCIRGVAPFEDATGDDITFAADPKFLKKVDETGAGAVIVPRNFRASSKNLVQVDNPQVAFARVVALFHPPLKPETGISPKAFIGDHFIGGQDISIAPFAVIQKNVYLGDRVIIHPNVAIGDNVVIGDDVEIFPNVTILERCKIGSRVKIQAGSVIGSDGFGFAPDGKSYYKIPQIGIVQIDDDVEIGAGNTIDRATFGRTWVKKGVKTDNLVHIAHNVTVGENTILVAQVGISGSVTIGAHAVLAGKVGVSGHLTIGDDVIIGAQSGISKSIPSGEVVSGSPEMPHRVWLKVQRILPRLPELKKKLAEIEKRLIKIEEKSDRNV